MAGNDVLFNIAVETRDAVKSIQDFTTQSQKSIDGLQKSVSAISFIEITRAAIDLGRVFANAFGSFIDKAADAEQATQKLNVALRLSGDFSDATFKNFQRLSSELQRQTGLDDDLINRQFALTKSFGLTNEESEKLVKAAIELSAVTGQDLQSAVEELNKTYSGQARSLAAISPEFKKLTQEQLAGGAAIDLINQKLGGTAENIANTFTGATRIAAASFSDFQEVVGSIITQSPQIVAILKQIGPFFDSLAKIVDENKVVFIDFVKGGIGFLIDGINLLVKAFDPLITAFGVIQKGIAILSAGAATIPALLSGSQASQDQIQAIGKELSRQLDEINKKTESRLKLADQVNSATKDFSKNVQTAQAVELKLANASIKASVARKEAIAEVTDEIRKQIEEQKKSAVSAAGSSPFAAFTTNAPVIKGASDEDKSQLQANREIASTLSAADLALKGSAGAVTLISSGLGALADTIIPGIGGLVAQITTVLAQGPEAAAAFVQGFIEGIPVIIENIILAIPAVLEAVANSIPVVIQRIIENIPVIIISLANSMPQVALAFALQMPIAVAKLAAEMPFVAVSFVASLISEVPKIVGAIIDEIKDTIGGAFGSVGEGIGNAVSAVGGFFGNVFGFAQGGIVPGTGTGDKVPALLTPGELVIDRSSTNDLTGFLESQKRGGISAEALESITSALMGGGQTVHINLTVGEKDLADVILNLNRNGFRTA